VAKAKKKRTNSRTPYYTQRNQNTSALKRLVRAADDFLRGALV
jgi:hypothetical protein